jgi:hypothetical protein
LTIDPSRSRAGRAMKLHSNKAMRTTNLGSGEKVHNQHHIASLSCAEVEDRSSISEKPIRNFIGDKQRYATNGMTISYFHADVQSEKLKRTIHYLISSVQVRCL